MFDLTAWLNERVVRDGFTDCWHWALSTTQDGYAKGQFDGKLRTSLHKRVYERVVGPVTAGLDLDHLCRNRRCLNPAHLEPVTRQENLARGRNAQRDKTHCIRGHAFTPENTKFRTTGVKKHVSRVCLTCYTLYFRGLLKLKTEAV